MVVALRPIAQTATARQHDETTFPWDILTDEDLASQVWSTVADLYFCANLVKDASALRVMLDCCRKVGFIDHDEYTNAISFAARGDYIPTGDFWGFFAISEQRVKSANSL